LFADTHTAHVCATLREQDGTRPIVRQDALEVTLAKRFQVVFNTSFVEPIFFDPPLLVLLPRLSEGLGPFEKSRDDNEP
jgi:hypothetical protein